MYLLYEKLHSPPRSTVLDRFTKSEMLLPRRLKKDTIEIEDEELSTHFKVSEDLFSEETSFNCFNLIIYKLFK